MGFVISDDLRVKAHMGLATAALVFLLPFAVNNFWQGRETLGFGSLSIVVLMAFNAFAIWRTHQVPLVTSTLLVVGIIAYLHQCFNHQGMVAVFWCYPATILFYFILNERQAWVINAVALLVFIPEAWDTIPPSLAARFTATLLSVSLFSTIFMYLLGRQQKRLREMAITDPLTGLFNRLLLDTFLERAARMGKRMSKPMTLVSVDLDHFKLINDRFGHEAGDRVLNEVGKVLLERIRKSDVAFRLGGEEFLVLLYDTELRDGRTVAEELRTKIAEIEVEPGHAVTASLGVATLSLEPWQEWLKRSDENLYAAKSEGRDRVV